MLYWCLPAASLLLFRHKEEAVPVRSKARYCVGLNGHPGNIEEILALGPGHIYEVYAAAPRNISPAGRRVDFPLSLKELKRQVRLAHQHKVRYNVLLNGSCMGGLEFSLMFRKKILNFISYLNDIEVDSVTVANPFLIDLIRKGSRKLEIIVGSFAEVTDPVKVERFRSRGADRIVLHQNVYRNFEMLKAIRKSTEMPLEIIPNQGCVNQCECFISHINMVAHSSIVPEKEIKAFGDFDYPIKSCRVKRQANPLEFLMSCFIRPEDLVMYEDMGFDIFKFAGRNGVSTEWMLNVIHAYTAREYVGNVFDLSSHVGASKKLCRLPNKALDGWYEHVGSNRDCFRFRKKAEEFSKIKGIARYFCEKT